MKNKLTSIIMFFIIIAIIVTFGLIGIIIWNEVSNNYILETAKRIEENKIANKTEKNEIIEKIEDDEDKLEEDIEVPEIKNKTNEADSTDTSEKSNPLAELEKSTSSNTQEEEKEEDGDDGENKEDTTFGKYFYDQLNKYSKIIYNTLEENKENMKSGTYKVNLGSSFSTILEKEDGQDELGDYYQSAIEAYVYDNPDVFFLSPSKMYLNIETTTRGSQKTYNTYIDCGEEANYLIDEFSSKADVEQALQAIENVRDKIINNKTNDTYKDIKMVHDYIINNAEYDMTISKENIYDIYGALVKNECVCEGYAKALKYLLDGLGIDSTLVIGKGTDSEGNSENHAWNYVNIDDTWYAIDTTWDDPVVIGGGFISNSNKYKYFLKGSNTMSKDHFPSGRFTKGGMEFEYPKLSKKDY